MKARADFAPQRLASRVRPPAASLAVIASLLVASCATAPAPVDSPPPRESLEPIVLKPSGKRYLENVFLFACATEYLAYETGDGPPVATRSAAERAAREQELTSCRDSVSEEYTKLDTVRRMTWNGETHLMTDAEMQAVVRDGEDFLAGYVKQLIEGEQSREGTLAGTAAHASQAPSTP